MQFLSNEDQQNPITCPLPIRPGFYNRFRWDAWEAITQFHIFRDKYERRTPKKQPSYHPHRHPKHSSLEYPEITDLFGLIHDTCRETEGEEVDRQEMEARKRRLMQITPSSPQWDKSWVWEGKDGQDKRQYTPQFRPILPPR